MGKEKRTRKFALMKRMMSSQDPRLYASVVQRLYIRAANKEKEKKALEKQKKEVTVDGAEVRHL